MRSAFKIPRFSKAELQRIQIKLEMEFKVSEGVLRRRIDCRPDLRTVRPLLAYRYRSMDKVCTVWYRTCLAKRRNY
jgi:hypothetical protein